MVTMLMSMIADGNDGNDDDDDNDEHNDIDDHVGDDADIR